MARLLRPYQPGNVIGDFQKDNQYYTGGDIEYLHGTLSSTPSSDPKLFARMVVRDGHHYFDIKQSDGQWHSYPVDYTIGSKWQQAYATKLPNGQIHVFPIQYNTLTRKWLNYWKSLDGPGTERSDPNNFENLDDATSYQAKCAICHTSQLRNTSGGGLEADHFYKDGRFGQSTFIVEALERSKCFRKGAVSCGTCHDPHGHDFSANQTSLEFKDQPDQMCVGCHTRFAEKSIAAAHTHHAPNSEGSRCIACHMPPIMDALAFGARTHQIDDIRNAEMTLRFGQQDSPNACLLCHTGKTPQWLQSELQSWKTKPLTASTPPPRP